MRLGNIFLLVFLITRPIGAVFDDEDLYFECERYFQAIKDKDLDLLPALARLNGGQCRNKQGQSALHVFAAIEHLDFSYDYAYDFIIRVLIYFGNEDVNVFDCYHNTPLMLAAGLGNHVAVSKLLSYPDLSNEQYEHMINLQNSFGFTALHYAVIARNRRIVNMLLNRGADMYIKDKNNRSSIELARLFKQDRALAFTR